MNPSRRDFLRISSLAAATPFVPYVFTAHAGEAAPPKAKNDRFRIGAIGMRYQGTVIAVKACEYGDVVAICDVDRHVREQARAGFGSTPAIYEDYRQLLDRKDIDVVTIGVPDHWHAAMVIDACRAGKDVYIEKPISLTIEEGRQIAEVVRQTGRVVQVGSWHRSDSRFRLAVEMVRQGRLGKLQRVEVVLGKNQTGGPFPERPVPGHLNWDLWQGPVPAVPYIEERCHYTFRWWYEYAGGQLTDWGAHHMDIAQWAIGDAGPVEIEGQGRFPEIPNGYNVAIDFQARYRYPSGVEMTVLDNGRNGILFEGTEGRIFVNRGTLEGQPVEALAAAPLPREQFKLYDFDNLDRPPREGKLDAIVNHMGNFFDCVKARRQPLSDVESQHRSATTCHLGNISMRLGRKLTWDPEKEVFVGDDEANAWRRRDRRPGFEIHV
ncbi:MAG: Gfo/Idh/MocA family oxidoreductase [Thermoguttaceae bacterium]|nr:Gfo/Idh/MocA family oxidoreductase [Thermoguttaceae bacterium]